MVKGVLASCRDRSGQQFSNFFNIQEMQQIQDAFAYATGVASIITDIVGDGQLEFVLSYAE